MHAGLMDYSADHVNTCSGLSFTAGGGRQRQCDIVMVALTVRGGAALANVPRSRLLGN